MWNGVLLLFDSFTHFSLQLPGEVMEGFGHNDMVYTPKENAWNCSPAAYGHCKLKVVNESNSGIIASLWTTQSASMEHHSTSKGR